MSKPQNIHKLQLAQEQRMQKQTKDRAEQNRAKKKAKGDYATTTAVLHTLAEIRENVEVEIVRYIDAELEKRPQNRGHWLPHLQANPVKATAELALRICLDAVHAQWGRTNTMFHLGRALEANVMNEVLNSTKKGRDLLKKVAQGNKDDGGSSYTMRQRAIYIASRQKKRKVRDEFGEVVLDENGQYTLEDDLTAYKWQKWSDHILPKVGGVMMDCVFGGAKGIFVFDEDYKETGDKHKSLWITLTDEAAERIASQEEWLDALSPIHAPMFSEPSDWNVHSLGPYNSTSLNMQTPVIRHVPDHQQEAINKAMLNGELDEALDGLNTLQKVPYSLNTYVLEAVKWVFPKVLASKGRLKIESFPSVIPQTYDKKRHNSVDRVDINNHNREVKANILGLKRRLHEADNLLSQSELTDRFYLPHNWDFRGRVYHAPEFGWHNTDYMRAMFLFANGEEVNEGNVHHLYHHLATSYGHGEDKKAFSDRHQWALDNMDKILSVGADYTNETTFSFWTGADDPFQFLAACHEMHNYHQHGEGYISGLPIGKDATQSGIQFYAVLGRNRKDGEKVNLTKRETPGDLYHEVLLVAQEILEGHIEELTAAQSVGNGLDDDDQKKLQCAEQWKAHGLTRKHLKSPTMTWSYSSDLFGFAREIRKSLMKDLTNDLRHGLIDEHPFGDDKGYAASWYFANIAKEAIEKTVESAGEGMKFVQDMAELCNSTNLHFHFKTPLNFPMMQFYREKNENLSIQFPAWDAQAAELKFKRASVQVYGDKIHEGDAVSGCSPNFIHSLDATLLMKSVLLSKKRGVDNMMTVHDSFSTTIGSVDVMVESIKESMINLFENYCPYNALFHQTMQRIGDKFELPDQLDLDINEIRDSDFFVS